ncbi:CHAD domain-containing protein [Novosphingobium humi]|uniref:CYTH and CHAD domain-containing protein n=1 Tax=Novosphingobium humi TaxID=2282397 RepID=UPI0025B2045B|nr:CHAD domain-containing protein [Novosphingobium humi]WJT00604.1 CHAD domain-containing protein [Novosphingobium humi]
MKNAPVEIEIKLCATPAMLADLQSHPRLAGKGRSAQFISTYFDTKDRLLEQAGVSLRIRSASGKNEQTAKAMSLPCGTVHREEWTTPLTGNLPQIERFPDPIRARLHHILGLATIAPTSISQIKRLRRSVTAGDSVLEADFDTGTLRAGDQVETVCELELELVEGRLPDLLLLALDLPLGPDLQWSVVSKSKRCAWRSAAADHLARAAQPPVLSKAMNVAAGFRAIGWNCLYQLLANYPLVIATGHPEAVHQCRIAIRRMRIAFRIFRPCLPEAQRPRLKAGIKAAGRILGRARDLHVLQQRLRDADGFAGSQAVLAAVERALAQATHQAGDMLASSAFQRLLFETAHAIEVGHGPDQTGDGPLRPFAADILSQRHAPLLDADPRLDRLSRREIHRLRIQAKELRYSCAFFRSLWPRSGGKTFTSRLEELQDRLGRLHDLAVASRAADLLSPESDPILAAQIAADLECMLRADGVNRKKLLRQAEDALTDWRKARRWWMA